ncbi:unnamed protein product [Paramecium pentaurelia]|uniref:C2H2-type domain-containing protein n=1 Tax=Paramecium pentaurelia TaxID=43138 RepID=A0A8S1WJ23_9CILI|nr:unnamed protein product [Paramecium pentaurelia]
MFIESIDHSTPRTIGDNEIQEQEYDQKINYKLEVRKSHLLQQFLRYQVENTQKSIVKLKKKISDDEVINKRISRKNSITKPFKCSICTHTYSSKAALKQHLKLKHFEEHTPLTQPLDQQKLLVEPLSQI